MRSVQSKGELTADSKTNQQSLTNAETEVVCVVTKTFGRKQFEQKSLAVDVVEMVSELSEATKSWITSFLMSVLPCRQSVKSDRGSESKKW